MPSTNKTLCLLAVTLAAAVAVAAADGPTWKDCGGAGAMATVSDISVVPFPVVPGKNVTLTVTVDIKETVMSGNVTTVGSYYGSPMAQHNGPACGTDYWTIQLDPAFSVTFNGELRGATCDRLHCITLVHDGTQIWRPRLTHTKLQCCPRRVHVCTHCCMLAIHAQAWRAPPRLALTSWSTRCPRTATSRRAPSTFVPRPRTRLASRCTARTSRSPSEQLMLCRTDCLRARALP